MGTSITDLLYLLSKHGGRIESMDKLTKSEIKQDRASSRIFIDENGVGYVWSPDLMSSPELFGDWYPLEVELPELVLNIQKLMAELKLIEKSTQN